MDQFVKMLYDRLASNKNLQLQLYVIMQNAINEMHNNGIIASLTGDAAKAVHDPDPDVRVREKTSIAKAVAKQFIPTTLPVPSQGGLSYLATLNYDPRFVNSITLCFQGGIEGLHMTFSLNPNVKLDKYMIQVISNGHNLTALENNIAQLDRMYDDISIVLMCDGKMIYNGQEEKEQPAPVEREKPVEKKGFFARLLGKKSKASSDTIPAVPVKKEIANPQPEKVKPVAPISKPTVTAAPAVQPEPVALKTPVQPKPQPRPVTEREMVKCLSDLCEGSSPAKEPSEEQMSKLRKLGAEFFGDVEQVMVNASGNTPDLQLDAITRFAQFMGNVPLADYSFAENTRCPEVGKLEYHGSWRAGGTCYDGGCYSDEPDDNYYFVLRRISFEEYSEKKVNRANLYKGSHSIWRYNADLPEANRTEVFADNRSHLYLKNPMGILGYFEIERDDR